MLEKDITKPDIRGIFKLSSIPKAENSARVAVNEPVNASTGFKKKRAKTKVLTKQARLPSRLFTEPVIFRLPSVFPTRAAIVSPMARKHKLTKAISKGKIDIQISEANNK